MRKYLVSFILLLTIFAVSWSFAETIVGTDVTPITPTSTMGEWINYTTYRDNVHAIVRDDNYLWWATSEGVVKWNLNNNTYQLFVVGQVVNSIAIDKEGNKWVNVVGGISKYDGKTWTTYPIDHGILKVIDNEGNKWFGTHGGGVSKFDGKNWKTYTIADGLASNHINFIAIDKENNKWFATDTNPNHNTLIKNVGGVNKFDGEKWTTYTTVDGLAHPQVVKIVIDKENNKWFATYGGVSKFEGKTWTKYTTADGLVNNCVYSIAIDQEGNKWFGTDNGVCVFTGE